jgi:lipoprotein NlpI
MSRIRGKDTTPERVVRTLLHRLGCRFRLHVRIWPERCSWNRCRLRLPGIRASAAMLSVVLSLILLAGCESGPGIPEGESVAHWAPQVPFATNLTTALQLQNQIILYGPPPVPMTPRANEYFKKVRMTFAWRWELAALQMKSSNADTGQIRTQFHLHPDGRISDLKILTNTFRGETGQTGLRIFSSEKPIDPWPIAIGAPQQAGYFILRTFSEVRYVTDTPVKISAIKNDLYLTGRSLLNPPPSVLTNFEADPADLVNGLSQMRTTRYAEAVTSFTKAIEWDPEEAWAFSGRGYCRYRLKDYDGAMADLSRAIELDPQQAGAWNTRGIVRTHFDDFSGAVADCSRSIQLDPGSWSAYDHRAYAKKRLQDFDGAAADIARCLHLNPTNPMAFYRRGQIRFSVGDYTNAMPDCARAIELNPRHAAAYELRGGIQQEQSEPSAALASYRRALELDPALDYARFQIWVLRSKAGEMESATQELAQHFQSRTNDSNAEWPYKVEAFLTGAMAEGEFLAAADGPARTPQERSQRQCEANYYAGMKRLLAGDREAAATLFQKSVATEMKDFIEYHRARAELNALTAAAPK